MALSDRMRGTVDSIMPKVATQVAQRSSKTPPIDFGTAENWLIRDELVDFAKDAVQKNLTTQDFSYQKGFAGDPNLIGALAGLFNRSFAPVKPVDGNHIALGPGGAAMLESLLLSICCPGDEMLVMAPFWSGFHFQFSAGPKVGIVPVLSKEEDALTDKVVDHLEAALANASKVKGVVLCNPHNPLGQCYPRHVLESIARFCEKHELHLISDEIYALSTFASPDIPDPVPFVSMLSLDLAAIGVDPARAHVIWSLSKDFGLSGLRMGAMVSQHNPAMVCGVAIAANTQVSSLTAIVGTALLQDGAVMDKFTKLCQERLSVAYSAMTGQLRALGVHYFPACAGIYVWARLSSKVSSWEQEGQLAALLAEKQVAVSAGKSYSAREPGWYRLSFALKQDRLEEGLRRLASGIEAFEATSK